MHGHELFLTERDRQVFPKTGYGGRVGMGARPVIIVIDVSYSFCGEAPEPILDAIDKYHNCCGEEAWAAVGAIERLLLSARERRLPIIYTTGYDHPIAGDFGLGRWADKCPAELDDQHERANQIVEQIAPRPSDILVAKTMPSAFFGTNLISYLVNLGADTLIVCGTATSGCVRATVVDGFSHNFRVCVVEEATFDRGQASHWINLFDMDMKYADVMGLEETVAAIERLPAGLFDEQMPALTAGPSAS